MNKYFWDLFMEGTKVTVTSKEEWAGSNATSQVTAGKRVFAAASAGVAPIPGSLVDPSGHERTGGMP